MTTPNDRCPECGLLMHCSLHEAAEELVNAADAVVTDALANNGNVTIGKIVALKDAAAKAGGPK